MNLDRGSAGVSKASAAAARVRSAVLHSAADPVVHEFAFRRTMGWCLRSSEGNGAAPPRRVVNLHAGRTTVTETSG